MAVGIKARALSFVYDTTYHAFRTQYLLAQHAVHDDTRRQVHATVREARPH